MGFIGLVRPLKFKDVEKLWFTIKTTIVGGVVYYTYYEGLWSKSEETAKLYQKVYGTVAPYMKDNIPPDVIQEVSRLPSMNNVCSLVKTSWNNGVMCSMEFLADSPTQVTKGVVSLSDAVQKLLQNSASQAEN